ncbi:hypothetical protein BDA96_10G268200 [Sorghum bicolor]|uniref:Uncharacterized protein n=1 Tax=Sorghum bicolor TaxID=4558 RepID=A0A921U253_SORBI|nr:hypothetical protein BDA96_10G268200 [Sorghum bicolor]
MGGKRVKRINSAPVIRPSRPHATSPSTGGRPAGRAPRRTGLRPDEMIARARKPGDPGRKDGQDHCARRTWCRRVARVGGAAGAWARGRGARIMHTAFLC